MPANIPEWHIKLNGANIAQELMNCLTKVTVESSMNIPAVATLYLDNLPLGDHPFKWIDATDMDPGTALSITIVIGSDSTSVFDGEVVEVEPVFGPDGYQLLIRAFDMLHRLSRGRKVQSFLQMNNQDIVSKVVQGHGLTLNYDNGNGPGQVYEHVL
ncbi:MAG TPA: hypothetical protein VIG44_13845, partial [Thermomicrobiales bacterium]